MSLAKDDDDERPQPPGPLRLALVSVEIHPLRPPGGPHAVGLSVHVASVSAALARRGHEVTVYTRRVDPTAPASAEIQPGVTVVNLPAGPPRPVSATERLAHVREFGLELSRALAQTRPQVIHTHGWMSGLAARVALRETDAPGDRLVTTFHSLSTIARRQGVSVVDDPPSRGKLETALARGAHRIIATSQEKRTELLRMGVERQRVDVVPCGVDVTAFTPDGPVAPRNARPRLLCVGPLVAHKGIDTVIAALRWLPGVEVVVAGGPSDGILDDHPEIRRLRALAGSMGVARRVIFLGAVSRPEMPALLRSADIVMSVGSHEPFGLVALEAMACGRPVVVSAVGGHLDTVVDDVTGMYVPPGRPDLVAAAAGQLLGDRFRTEALGHAGVDRAEMRFSWDRIAAETDAVYARVVAAAAADRVLEPGHR
jgi:D-inositol-3-phosphate glycosyltransferase